MSVLVYTDGISEAANAADELFGVPRLRERFGKSHESPRATGEAILRDVREFVAGERQSDDITVICFSRTK